MIESTTALPPLHDIGCSILDAVCVRMELHSLEASGTKRVSSDIVWWIGMEPVVSEISWHDLVREKIQITNESVLSCRECSKLGLCAYLIFVMDECGQEQLVHSAFFPGFQLHMLWHKDKEQVDVSGVFDRM